MHLLVENFHRVVLDVKVAGCATQIRGVQLTGSLLKTDHSSLIQGSSSRHDQLSPFATQIWVIIDCIQADTVDERILSHPDEEVRVAEPLDGLIHVGDRSKRNFRIKVIRHGFFKAALDGILAGEQGEIVGQLVVRSDDGAVTRFVELGSSGTAENLEHVQDTDVDEGTVFGIIDFRSFDDDSVSWKVNTPT